MCVWCEGDGNAGVGSEGGVSAYIRGSGGLSIAVNCEGGVVLCLCVLCVWILCIDGRSRYLYIVLGGYLHILGAPSVQSCCTISISCGSRTWISLDITRFYEEHCLPSSGSA